MQLTYLISVFCQWYAQKENGQQFPTRTRKEITTTLTMLFFLDILFNCKYCFLKNQPNHQLTSQSKATASGLLNFYLSLTTRQISKVESQKFTFFSCHSILIENIMTILTCLKTSSKKIHLLLYQMSRKIFHKRHEIILT